MNKEQLELYSEQYSSGAKNHIDKLYAQMATSLLIIPIVKHDPVNSRSGCLTVMHPVYEEIYDIFCINEMYKTIFPVFTTRKAFAEWKKKVGTKLDETVILGVDMCMIMRDKMWLLLDPGSENEKQIQPYIISQIAAAADSFQYNPNNSWEEEMEEEPEDLEVDIEQQEFELHKKETKLQLDDNQVDQLIGFIDDARLSTKHPWGGFKGKNGQRMRPEIILLEGKPIDFKQDIPREEPQRTKKILSRFFANREEDQDQVELEDDSA
ncbi:MAG: SseB family protein [Deltaproteobacteria bacterium]|nr:SseB family protein [Deltaproteobacteria bacterium]